MFTLIAASLFQIAIADASARLTPGDVVVLDIGIGGDVGPEIVFRVDPATGVRSIFQNLRDIDPAAQVFGGGDIAIEQSGNVLITESRLGPDGIEHALVPIGCCKKGTDTAYCLQLRESGRQAQG